LRSLALDIHLEINTFCRLLTLMSDIIATTWAARIRSHVRSCEIYGGHSGTGTGFLRVHRFPLPILIPPTAPCSLIIHHRCYMVLILIESLNKKKHPSSIPNAAKYKDGDSKESQPLECNSIIYLVQSWAGNKFDTHTIESSVQFHRITGRITTYFILSFKFNDMFRLHRATIGYIWLFAWFTWKHGLSGDSTNNSVKLHWRLYCVYTHTHTHSLTLTHSLSRERTHSLTYTHSSTHI
jgi:hypothetical protein